MIPRATFCLLVAALLSIASPGAGEEGPAALTVSKVRIHRSLRSGPDRPRDRVPPPDRGEDPPGEPFDFRLLAEGDCLIRTPQNVVVRTQEEWQAFFYLYRGDPPPEPRFPLGAGYVPPVVDFDREMVVGVFLGTRPTGGYAVSIESVRTARFGFRVEYLETRPGPSCVVTQALTNPFVLVAVAKVAGSATFAGTTRVLDCR